MTKEEKAKMSLEQELEEYLKWFEDPECALVLDRDVAYESEFRARCKKCKYGKPDADFWFGPAFSEKIPCTKIKAHTIEGLFVKVTDKPWGECKYFEPKK